MPNDQRTRGVRPDVSNLRTIQQYAAQAISRNELTRAAAQAAMEKATRPDVREIAGYELMEAKAVISCLKELGAPVPPLGPDARSALETISNASRGNAFDRAYIAAQCENHAFLRDLTAAYLECGDPQPSDPRERQGRQLAAMALCMATEHAAVTNRISREMRG
ncbi:MAG: DUF4142 domain-containing protein [Hyphomicrobiaceae bacterium]